MHRQPRHRNRSYVDDAWVYDSRPGNAALLGEVIVEGAKARQVLRRETAFAADRITGSETVSARQQLVNADGALISKMMFVTHVGVVIAIDAGAHDSRRTHHGHAAAVHPHVHVGPRHVLSQKGLRSGIDQDR